MSTTCPCGIHRADCEYHRPQTSGVLTDVDSQVVNWLKSFGYSVLQVGTVTFDFRGKFYISNWMVDCNGRDFFYALIPMAYKLIEDGKPLPRSFHEAVDIAYEVLP